MSQPNFITAVLSSTPEFLSPVDYRLHDDWLLQSLSSDADSFDDDRFESRYDEGFTTSSPFASSSASSYEPWHSSTFTSPSSLHGLTGTGSGFGIETW
jgi:hypothetical protein